MSLRVSAAIATGSCCLLTAYLLLRSLLLQRRAETAQLAQRNLPVSELPAPKTVDEPRDNLLKLQTTVVASLEAWPELAVAKVDDLEQKTGTLAVTAKAAPAAAVPPQREHWPRIEVPTLESLAVAAVARSIHADEPLLLSGLPYNGGAAVIQQLVQQGRLRPETLGPVLLSDWSSIDALAPSLGESLVVLAPGSRGLAALAAQRLRFQASASCRERGGEMLPSGTRHSSSASAMAAR